MPRQSTAAECAIVPQPAAVAALDWSDWERWLRGQLTNELKALHTALGQLLADERDRFERRADAFEIKLAKLTGAIDILRGAAPPPPAKFPTIKAWSADASIHYQGAIVTFNGSTYQAQCDTARAPAPDTSDWTCLAAVGAGFRLCGTYDVHKKYQKLDVVIVNGSSFAALKNAPGPCPGDDWRLLSGRGSRGGKGETGERGPRGEKGDKGQPGTDALTIVSWMLDRARYRAIPMMSNGKPGPELELRGLFEQFLIETTTSKG
jgi:hypothetical protein